METVTNLSSENQLTLQKENYELRLKVETLEKTVTSLRETCAHQTEELQKAKSEKKYWENKAKDSEAVVRLKDILRRQRQIHKEKLQASQKAKAEFKETISQLKTSSKHDGKRIQKLKRIIKQKTCELRGKQAEIERREKNLVTVRKKYKVKNCELKKARSLFQKNNNIIFNNVKKLASLERQLKCRKDSIAKHQMLFALQDGVIEELREKVGCLEDDLGDLKNLKEECEQANYNLFMKEKELKEMSETVKNLTDIINDSSESINQDILNNIILQRNEEIEQLNSKCDKILKFAEGIKVSFQYEPNNKQQLVDVDELDALTAFVQKKLATKANQSLGVMMQDPNLSSTTNTMLTIEQKPFGPVNLLNSSSSTEKGVNHAAIGSNGATCGNSMIVMTSIVQSLPKSAYKKKEIRSHGKIKKTITRKNKISSKKNSEKNVGDQNASSALKPFVTAPLHSDTVSENVMDTNRHDHLNAYLPQLQMEKRTPKSTSTLPNSTCFIVKQEVDHK